ncbi:MAG: hypothetical protein PHE02_14040 [Lachnospiraceae bacterium]|nr:hypothetical protein [Lachnospiraceae bacterium]
MRQDWDHFLTTGSVADYLSYKGNSTTVAGQETQEHIWTGDNLYAGFPKHNGNGDEGGTYRGIR